MNKGRGVRRTQINAGQPVFECDLLSAQVLLDGDREVGASLHCRVVADDHALHSAHVHNTYNIHII